MATDTENSDVFDLEGEHYFFEGQGARIGSEEETEEFPLSKGLLIWGCGHEGTGEFFVTLWNDPWESDGAEFTYFRPCGLAADSGEGFWEGAFLVGPDERGFWEGLFDDDLGPPEPSKRNLLKVGSSGPWFCHLFQPALGQLASDFPYCASGDADSGIAGFFRVGSRPLRLTAQHDGGGEFIILLMSFDGTDVCEVLEENGQCQFERQPLEDDLIGQTEADQSMIDQGKARTPKPGKEYLLLVQATGTWNLTFTEGY